MFTNNHGFITLNHTGRSLHKIKNAVNDTNQMKRTFHNRYSLYGIVRSLSGFTSTYVINVYDN